MTTMVTTAAHRPHQSRTDQSVEETAFRRYRATRDRGLRNEIVEAHAAFALSLARRFARRGEPLDDLRQIALLGLLKAVERFDPGREVPFHAFAKPTILGELRRYFRDKGWSVRVPRGLQELRLAANDLVSELSQTLGRAPTIAELAEATGVSEEQVLLAMEAGHMYTPDSLDLEVRPAHGDGTPTRRSDLVGDVDSGFDGVVDREAVARSLRCLPERDRTIVYLRFYQDLTQSEIATRLGISQMHVSRLLTRSMDRLASVVPDQARNR